jgi:hypothetical protein
LDADSVPSLEEYVTQHVIQNENNPKASKCVMRLGDSRYAVSHCTNILQVGLVFQKMCCTQCNTEVLSKDLKFHEVSHKEVNQDGLLIDLHIFHITPFFQPSKEETGKVETLFQELTPLGLEEPHSDPVEEDGLCIPSIFVVYDLWKKFVS